MYHDQSARTLTADETLHRLLIAILLKFYNFDLTDGGLVHRGPRF